MHPDSQLKDAINKGFDPKSLYNPHLNHVAEPVRSILEDYSKVPEDKILQHVQALVCGAITLEPFFLLYVTDSKKRDEAFAIVSFQPPIISSL